MSSKKYKLTIFCSIFKCEKYIEHYLSDISRQTIFSDCELIMVDANSPENESKYIKPFAHSHKNVKYIELDKDPGMYECWNIAVREAQGKYLNNANPDDGKHRTFLKEHVRALDSDKSIDLIYCDSLITTLANTSFDSNTHISRYSFPEFSIEDLIIYNMPHQSPVYRKSMHDRFGFFNNDYKSAADSEFWLRCATQGAKFKKLNKTLGLYYLNPEGVSTSSENQEWRQKEELDIKQKYANIINYTGKLHGSLSAISGL